MVNNAGINAETSSEAAVTMPDVNAKGTFFGAPARRLAMDDAASTTC